MRRMTVHLVADLPIHFDLNLRNIGQKIKTNWFFNANLWEVYLAGTDILLVYGVGLQAIKFDM